VSAAAALLRALQTQARAVGPRDSHHLDLTGEKIEAELAQICEDILDVLDKHLIPSAASGESKVFYHKMCVAPRLWLAHS
jgi:hypothetical protein